jgi:hypothetical protein
MANAALSTFIIDLKLTADGQVRILEFGRAWNQSGFSGHDRLCEQQALRDKIAPFYRSFGRPFVQMGNYDERFFPINADYQIKQDAAIKNEREAYLNLRHAITPQALEGPDGRVSLENIEHHAMIVLPDHLMPPPYQGVLRYLNMEFNPALVIDRNHALYACMHNKALLHMLVGRHAPEIFPASEIIINGRKKPDWSALDLGQRRWSDGAVIKAPAASRGEGVGIVSPASSNTSFHRKLDETLEMMRGVCDQFMLVAQPVIHGRRVTNPQDGKRYDPTIRVAVSAVYNRGALRLEWHNVAYNKFPSTPAAARTNKLSLKSLSEGASTLLDPEEQTHIECTLNDKLVLALKPLFDRSIIATIDSAFAEGYPLAPHMVLALLESQNYCGDNDASEVVERYGGQLDAVVADLQQP